MNQLITPITSVDTKVSKQLSFMPTTGCRVQYPKNNLSKEEKEEINEHIFINCMYLKEHLARG